MFFATQGGSWVYFALHHGLLPPSECIPLHKCLPLYHYITFQPIVAHPGCPPCWSLRCLPQTVHTKKACFWVVLHRSSGIALMHPQVLSVKCYESQIVRQTIKNCPTDNLKLSEENRQRDNSLQPVVSKSGCETTNKVLSLKCYERQIVRRTIKNCLTDNLKLSVGQKDKALSVKCYERQIVRRTIKNCPTDNKKLSDGQFKIGRKGSSTGHLIAACGK